MSRVVVAHLRSGCGPGQQDGHARFFMNKKALAQLDNASTSRRRLDLTL